MTVWIYVNTSKQVGDKDHLKVFAKTKMPDNEHQNRYSHRT